MYLCDGYQREVMVLLQIHLIISSMLEALEHSIMKGRESRVETNPLPSHADADAPSRPWRTPCVAGGWQHAAGRGTRPRRGGRLRP